MSKVWNGDWSLRSHITSTARQMEHEVVLIQRYAREEETATVTRRLQAGKGEVTEGGM